MFTVILADDHIDQSARQLRLQKITSDKYYVSVDQNDALPYLIDSEATESISMANTFLDSASKFLVTEMPRYLLWTGVVSLKVFATGQLLIMVFHAPNFTTLMHVLASKVMDKFSEDHNVPDDVRSIFSTSEFVTARVVNSHSHGDSAASRSTATLTCEHIASQLGLICFFNQMSKSDERYQRNGYRSWFWGKDMHITPAYGVPDNNSLNVHIDTDYYYDMNTHLADTFRPTLLYTFCTSSFWYRRVQ